MRAYSQDLRDRAFAALERGECPGAVVRRLEVGRTWLWRLAERRARTGGREALPGGGARRPSKLAHLEAEMRGWIAERPDLTLEEMRGRLVEGHGVSISSSGLWYQLSRWGLTFKKKASTPASRASART